MALGTSGGENQGKVTGKRKMPQAPPRSIQWFLWHQRHLGGGWGSPGRVSKDGIEATLSDQTHTHIFLLPLGKLFSSIISLYSFKKDFKKILHPLLEVGTLGAVEKHMSKLWP